ncbi:MAG TPA: phosphate-starvation-inducible PsiE family protein [Terriglobales bacterium]|nr:phosphate-starvation-inducible PsiE family protein [Terriglobales bacterium]
MTWNEFAVVEQRNRANHPARRRFLMGLSSVEDTVYVGLGVLLSVTAVALLVNALYSLVSAVAHRALDEHIVGLLDQMLLILLVVELLYTVQVSFRERGLAAEPFLVVALIAVIRRILVLTAELPKLPQGEEIVFRRAILELGLLAGMILVLVTSFLLLQKYTKHPTPPE